MSEHQATPEQWAKIERFAKVANYVEDSCILELRARVEALEAQADHIPGVRKMVPPPVATDEELRSAWNVPGTNLDAFRAIYNLGVAHGQARSREVADPAPVTGELVERVAGAIHEQLNEAGNWEYEARAAVLEVARWLREQGWIQSAILIEQEAGR